MKTLIRAKSAGFCFGVSLAIKKLDDAIASFEASGEKKKRIFTLGPIIHNPSLVAAYNDKGVRCLESFESLEEGDIVLIRAHGISKEREACLHGRGVRIIDATCPKVKKAQLAIEKQAKLGQYLLLFGEEEHPEVQGLLSYAESGAAVFETLEELQTLLPSCPEPVFLAAQTTQDQLKYEQIIAFVEEQTKQSIVALQTICGATVKRQQEVLCMAQDVDFLVVVGGKNSGNTKRLASIAEENGISAMHVETAEELDLSTLQNYSRVGITAGASTPESQIRDVEQLLSEFLLLQRV